MTSKRKEIAYIILISMVLLVIAGVLIPNKENTNISKEKTPVSLPNSIPDGPPVHIYCGV